jgi:hypothetical protein
VSAASAKGSPHFRRGHLPAIGEIKLVKEKGGLAEITVPVHYTQALSGNPTGLETAEVSLHIARKVKARRAVGATLTRTITTRWSGPASSSTTSGSIARRPDGCSAAPPRNAANSCGWTSATGSRRGAAPSRCTRRTPR